MPGQLRFFKPQGPLKLRRGRILLGKVRQQRTQQRVIERFIGVLSNRLAKLDDSILAPPGIAQQRAKPGTECGVVRFQLDGKTRFGKRFVDPMIEVHDAAQIIVCGRELRIQLNPPAGFHLGIILLALLQQDATKVAVNSRRIESNFIALRLSAGLVKLVQLPKNVTEVLVRPANFGASSMASRYSTIASSSFC